MKGRAALLTSLFALTAMAALLVHRLQRALPAPDQVAQWISRTLSDRLAVPATVGYAGVGLTGAWADDIRIATDPHSPTGPFLKISSLSFRWSLQTFWSLVTKGLPQDGAAIPFRRITLRGAQLFIYRDKNGVWNVDPLIRRRKPHLRIGVEEIVIQYGTLRFRDDLLPLPSGRPFEWQVSHADGVGRIAEGVLDLTLSGSSRGPERRAAGTVRLHLSVPLSVPAPWLVGKVTLSSVPVDLLPSRLRYWLNERVRFEKGYLEKADLTYRADGLAKRVVWDIELGPVQVGWARPDGQPMGPVRGRLTGRWQSDPPPSVWSLTIELAEPHPDFGIGRLTVSGDQAGFELGWEGSDLNASLLAPFLPQGICKGQISGSLHLAHRDTSWRLSGRLEGRRLVLSPERTQRWRISFPPIPWARWNGTLEGSQSRWSGHFTASLGLAKGTLTAECRPSGERGRGTVRLVRFPVAPFHEALMPIADKLPLPFERIDLVGGEVSGEAQLQWDSHGVRVRSARIGSSRFILTVPDLPEAVLDLKGWVRDGQGGLDRFGLTVKGAPWASGRLRWSDGGEDFVTITATGTSEGVVRGLNWLSRRFSIPVHLLLSGPLNVSAFLSSPRDWIVKGKWSGGSVEGRKVAQGWRATVSEALFLTEPVGVFGRLGAVEAEGSPSAPQPLSDLKATLSDLRLFWDFERKQLAGEATVLVSATVSDLKVRAQMAGRLRGLFGSQKSRLSAQWLEADDLRVAIGRSFFTDGRFRWDLATDHLVGSATVRELPLNDVLRLTQVGNGALSGTFSGTTSFSGQDLLTRRLPSSSFLSVTLSGSVRDATASGSFVGGNRISISHAVIGNLACVLALSKGRLSVASCFGNGSWADLRWQGKEGREFALKEGVLSWATEGSSADRKWDLKIYRATGGSFEVSGSASGQGEEVKGVFSVTAKRLDALLTAFRIRLKEEIAPLKVPVRGWVRFEGHHPRQIAWDGAVRVGMGRGEGWTLASAGLRAEGTITDGLSKSGTVTGVIRSLQILSDLGEGDFTGTFHIPLHSDPTTASKLKLKGKWVRLPLKRFSKNQEGLDLAGSVSTNVEAVWDGRLRAEGVLTTPLVVCNGVPVESVTASWKWDRTVLSFDQGSARVGSGQLTFSGKISKEKKEPSFIDAAFSRVPVGVIAKALPSSDQLDVAKLNGSLEGEGRAVRTNTGWEAVLSGRVSDLGNGSEKFGDGDGQLQVRLPEEDQRWRRAEVNWSFAFRNGTGSLTTHGRYRESREWQVDWQVGNWSLSSLQSLALSVIPALKADERFSRPMHGFLWSEGEVSGRARQVQAVRGTADLSGFRLAGFPPLRSRLHLLKERDEWIASVEYLRSESGQAWGSVLMKKDGIIDGRFEGRQLDLPTVNHLLKLIGHQPLPLRKVNLSGVVNVSGQTTKPKVTGALTADDLDLGTVRLTTVRAESFEYRDGVLSVPEGAGQAYLLAAGPAWQFWGSVDIKDQGRLDLTVAVERSEWEDPDHRLTALDWTGGWLEGQVQITGSFHQPQVRGSLRAGAKKIGLVKGALIPPLEDVTVDLTADGSQIQVARIYGRFGGGRFEGRGVFSIADWSAVGLGEERGEVIVRLSGAQLTVGPLPVPIREAIFRASLRDQDVTLSVDRMASDGLSVTGTAQYRMAWGVAGQGVVVKDGPVRLTAKAQGWSLRTPEVSGRLSGTIEVRKEEGEGTPTIFGALTVHDGQSRGLPSAVRIVPGSALPSLPLDLTVHIGKNFYLRTGQATLLLTGTMRALGTLNAPEVSGIIQSRRGTVRLPASVVAITDMEVSFRTANDPVKGRIQTRSRIRLEGETRLDIYQILISLSGPIDEESQRMGLLPMLSVMTSPPLPEATVIQRLFGLGFGAVTGAGDLQQIVSGTFVKGLTGELFAPLTEPIIEALRLSELSLVASERAEKGWLRLGFSPTPRLHFIYRRGLSPLDPSAVEVQYFVGNRTSVTWKKEKERSEIRVQTSVRF